jgi:cellobiose-specific phosphotransferase system component IIB
MKYSFIIIFCLFVLHLTAQTISISPNELEKPSKISLDGIWDFIPINITDDAFKSGPEHINTWASKIFKEFDDQETVFQVKVPQMLNKISWWLPNVSLGYEKSEEERIAALPFNSEDLRAGWYIKTIDLTESDIVDKEIFANFEGIATVSRVYLNGNFVGGHLGMFGAFETRLTPHLKAGILNQLMVYTERGVKAENGDDVVSVAVTVPVTKDMLMSLNSGLFGGFGNGPRAKFLGIWQPVHLTVSEKGGKIEDVFFNPTLTGHQIHFSIENPNKDSISGYWSYKITDKVSGQLLVEEEFRDAVHIPSNETKTLTISKENLSPKHWTPDHPNLYKLEANWKNLKGEVIDSYKCQIGYRTVEAKGEQIYLNGKPYWIRGANMPPYGYKSNDSVLARNFLQLMHDGNTVVTRTHGNPWNHMWYTAADEVGIGVSSEGVRPWALMTKSAPPPDAILAHWKQEQLESIKEYRNHPSILFYVISNEGLQADHENEEKLLIFKDIIDAVKKMDPSRLVFQTSGDPDHNDNADIEDVHAYWGWYESSSFVNDYTKPRRGLTLGHDKPFVNQECAVPYSMIDDGAVHPSYVGRYSAQTWVGDIGTLGKDHSYFQDHIYLEGKMKTEKLRYSRSQLPTAGFMLFSNLTWIQHAFTRPPDQWKPFPIYEGVKQGFQPILVALETPQRFFYEGDDVSTNLFIVNDDTKFRDLGKTNFHFSIESAEGKELMTVNQSIKEIPYFEVEKIPFTFSLPKLNDLDQEVVFKLRLKNKKNELISENSYRMILKKKVEKPEAAEKISVIALGCNENVNQFLEEVSSLKSISKLKSKVDVIILGPNAADYELKQVRKHLKKEGRLILLQQGENAHTYVEDVIKIPTDLQPGDKPAMKDFMFDSGAGDLKSIEYATGEFVEMLDWDKQKPIFNGLDAMDWKWWMTGNNNPAYVASSSHKLNIENDKVIPLGRFLNSHFYWSGNLKNVYDNKIGYPVFAVKYAWGDIIVCDLVISEALEYDPRAAITLRNLMYQTIDK